MNYSSWYNKVFPGLSGCGLWLRGGELNTLPAAGFEQRPFRVLITRLSTYRDTADSFTHKLLYQIISRISGAFPDLAYLPPPKDAVIFDRDRVPWLLGTASKHEGRDFTVIALSNSIVQELMNVPVMLEKSGIPLSKRERMRDPACPLVILGGASALYTSILFNDDPPVDGIFAGGDAGVIGRLFKVCKDGFDRKLSKKTVLERLGKIPGFFTPEGEHAIKIFQAAELPPEQLLESEPVLYEKECIGKANLQISEGCAFFCGFCAESFGRKPYREFEAGALYEAALRLKAATGAQDLEIYSFNFSSHRHFYRLLWELSDLFPSIGLKSQRFDSIAADPEMVMFLHAINKTSITCGIEGISPRLRRYLHKSLEARDLEKGLSVLLASPLRELKIFLIATGLEQQGDYNEFKKLLGFLQTLMGAAENAPRIIFSMTVLVRFPWTPLEFEDAPDPDVCQAVLRRTEQLVLNAGFEFRASSGVSDYWLSQLLARADDPRIAKALRQAQEREGFVYYREIPPSLIDDVRRYLEREGVRPDALFRGFTPQERPAKPWSALLTGVSEEFLIKQWESAKRCEDNGCCIGTSGMEGTCCGCNACGDGPARKRLSARPVPRQYSLRQFRNRQRAAKAQEVALRFRVQIGPALAGVPYSMRGTALARSLMMADRRLVQGYRGFQGSSVFNRLGSDWVIGDDLLTLLWETKAAAVISDSLKDAVFLETVNTMLAGRGRLSAIAASDEIEIKTIVFRAPFRFDPSGYCERKSLKFMLRKNGPDISCYVLSKESLKKKIVNECMAERGSDGQYTVTVIPGPKFIPEEFARTAFSLPAENEWVRIAMTANYA